MNKTHRPREHASGTVRCYREACQREIYPEEAWYNSSTKRLYCVHCARMINDANGGRLCTPIEVPFAFYEGTQKDRRGDPLTFLYRLTVAYDQGQTRGERYDTEANPYPPGLYAEAYALGFARARELRADEEKNPPDVLDDAGRVKFLDDYAHVVIRPPIPGAYPLELNPFAWRDGKRWPGGLRGAVDHAWAEVRDFRRTTTHRDLMTLAKKGEPR